MEVLEPSGLFLHCPAGRAQGRWKTHAPGPAETGPPLQVTGPAAVHRLGWGRIQGTRPEGETEGSTERGEGRGCWGVGVRAGGRSRGLCSQENRVKTSTAETESGPEPQPHPSGHQAHSRPEPRPRAPHCQGEAWERRAAAQERGAQALPERPRAHHRNWGRQTWRAGCEEPIEISNKWTPDAGKRVSTLARE